MISSKSLQREYIKLYKQMRNYIWDVETVSDLANFEVEVFTTFPNLSEIRRLFQKLKSDVRDIIDDEKDDYALYDDDVTLESAFDDFDKLLNYENTDELYANLSAVQEVNYNEDSEDENTSSRGSDNTDSSRDNGSNIIRVNKIHRRN